MCGGHRLRRTDFFRRRRSAHPRLLKRRIPRRPARAHPLRNRCLLRPKASGFRQTCRSSAHRKSAAHSAESDAAFLLCVAALRRGRLYPADPPAAGASDNLPDADALRFSALCRRERASADLRSRSGFLFPVRFSCLRCCPCRRILRQDFFPCSAQASSR